MKRVLIIGATSAIATSIARIWARDGSTLCLVGRNTGRLDSLAEDLKVRGASAVSSIAMDANSVASHQEMLGTAVRNLGGIDIVLIAHGTLPNQLDCEKDVALTLEQIAINGTSTMALLTIIATVLEGQRHGAIGVITSVAGDRGRRSNYVYGAAKAAVSVFCEGLRGRLFASGVSVTDIRPGFIASPMTQGLPIPKLLLTQPADIAQRVVKGIEKGRSVVYAPAYWRLIMFAVRMIPAWLFKRMAI